MDSHIDVRCTNTNAVLHSTPSGETVGQGAAIRLGGYVVAVVLDDCQCCCLHEGGGELHDRNVALACCCIITNDRIALNRSTCRYTL
jgi:hypothetical protein